MPATPISKTRRPLFRRAFTLVELLVVITIIGILIALILPAVQAAREAARMMQCQNNLKQIGLACLAHEQSQGYLPTAGWGYKFAGDPTRGFDERQPGGWLYNILPYLELSNLHDLGADGNQAAMAACLATPIATYNCPSRRAAIAFTSDFSFCNVSPSPTVCGRSDYAGSGGDHLGSDPCGGTGPSSLAQGDAMTASQWANYPGTSDTGVFYVRCRTCMASISDGTSNTYLAGEKFCDPLHYIDGLSQSDDASWNDGWDWDVVRWSGMITSAMPKGGPYASMQPTPDTMGYWISQRFGSAHVSSFNMVFCDGSVHTISYSIDLDTHHRLGNRADGLPISGGQF